MLPKTSWMCVSFREIELSLSQQIAPRLWIGLCDHVSSPSWDIVWLVCLHAVTSTTCPHAQLPSCVLRNLCFGSHSQPLAPILNLQQRFWTLGEKRVFYVPFRGEYFLSVSIPSFTLMFTCYHGLLFVCLFSKQYLSLLFSKSSEMEMSVTKEQQCFLGYQDMRFMTHLCLGFTKRFFE